MEAIATIEGLLAGRVGLRIDPVLRARLARCVSEEASALGVGLDRYAAVLDRDPRVFQRLVDRVTVQQTSFFRDPNVYRALATSVLPRLREPVLAWSAGCANGQEAYSLAMVFAEAGLKDWKVLGTDVSAVALARAQAAIYSTAETLSLGPQRRAIHMQPAGERWEMVPALRRRVEFQLHNLVADPSPLPAATCQLIFCRNVLIYLEPGELSRVLHRLATVVDPAGYVFLGASESLWPLTDRFRLSRLDGAFVYRPATAEPAPGERRRTAPPPKQPRLRGAPEFLAAGEAAAAANDFPAATAAFQRATSIDPDNPVAHFQLALCLERAGHREAALRSFRAARSAMERGDASLVEAALEGFHPQELVAAIDMRLSREG